MISVIIGERGEPMGVPKTCLKYKPLNLKKVESKTKLTAVKNSFSGIGVLG